jgi:hypothetical protein
MAAVALRPVALPFKVPAGIVWCATMGQVKEPPPLRTIARRSDEPTLEIGDTISTKEGVVGVVLARYTPSGDRKNEVRYIVQLTQEETNS